MANKHRGYVPIEIGGETAYLRYNFEALATLDERLAPLGTSFLGALQNGLNFHVLRLALLVGLSNPANPRGAAKLIRKLDLTKVDYYLDRILDALEAAELIKKGSEEASDEDAGEDDEGEA